MTFEQWMALINQAIMLEVGITTDDLTDQSYRDWYESEMTPQEAADQALADNGYNPDGS
jgi:hypothetical protein